MTLQPLISKGSSQVNPVTSGCQSHIGLSERLQCDPGKEMNLHGLLSFARAKVNFGHCCVRTYRRACHGLFSGKRVTLVHSLLQVFCNLGVPNYCLLIIFHTSPLITFHIILRDHSCVEQKGTRKLDLYHISRSRVTFTLNHRIQRTQSIPRGLELLEFSIDEQELNMKM